MSGLTDQEMAEIKEAFDLFDGDDSGASLVGLLHSALIVVGYIHSSTRCERIDVQRLPVGCTKNLENRALRMFG